ncbi:MAG: mechanosensitive ion channel [Acutalibacteraceae bacterium]|nr:mechanosensitive ion channel [Acutalibacteraceae bacterium]
MLRFFNFLTQETTEAITDATTTSNIFLDESGQFVDPSQAVDNVTSWWEELDLINKIIEKVPTLIIAVVVLVLGFFAARLISKLVVKAMKAKNVDPSVYNFIRRIVSATIKAFVIMSAVSMFFDLSSFVAAIGGAGLAAGLGLQASVSQFVSGIQILINRPFKNGDFVEVNGVSGNVTDIRFMDTVITTVDNKRVIIPNSHITSNHIINYSAEDKRMLNLIYSISYSDDIAKAKNVILSVADKNELILKDPETKVYVDSHGANSINLVAKVWCNVGDYWPVYFRMQEDIKIAFDNNGISIPFNQLDVHITQ